MKAAVTLHTLNLRNERSGVAPRQLRDGGQEIRLRKLRDTMAKRALRTFARWAEFEETAKLLVANTHLVRPIVLKLRRFRTRGQRR